MIVFILWLLLSKDVDLVITIHVHVHGDFFKTLKICKKSKCDWNQFKLSTQHKNMYMHQEKV